MFASYVEVISYIALIMIWEVSYTVNQAVL